MTSLEKCALWKDPEATVAKGLKEQFELQETYFKDSHWWRYLLACRGCGRLYIFEFWEEIDWQSGNDPQFTTWVPVAEAKDISVAHTEPSGSLRSFVPRLCKDWPKDEKRPRIYWVTGDPNGAA
jgi:hypothetical protein